MSSAFGPTSTGPQSKNVFAQHSAPMPIKFGASMKDPQSHSLNKDGSNTNEKVGLSLQLGAAATLPSTLGASTSPAGSLGKTTSWYWSAMEKEGAGGLSSPFAPSPVTAHKNALGSNQNWGRYSNVSGISEKKLKAAAQSMRAISTPSAGLDVRLSLPKQRRKGTSVFVRPGPPSSGSAKSVPVAAVVSDAVPPVSHSKMERAVSQMRSVSTPSAGLNITVKLPTSVQQRQRRHPVAQATGQATNAVHYNQDATHLVQPDPRLSNIAGEVGSTSSRGLRGKVSSSTGTTERNVTTTATSPQRKRICKDETNN